MGTGSRVFTEYEPQLGGQRAYLTGCEPALSGAMDSLFTVFGPDHLRAPDVIGRRQPLVVITAPDPGLREIMGLSLELFGYRVAKCKDGRETLGVVRALEPNLLITVMNLVDLHGLELAARVRADRNKVVAGIPILLCYSPLEIASSLFQSGIDDVLDMPLDFESYLVTCRRLVGNTRRPAPLMALFNRDASIRLAAISYLLEVRPPGLEAGLRELTHCLDGDVRTIAKQMLRRMRVEACSEVDGLG